MRKNQKMSPNKKAFGWTVFTCIAAAAVIVGVTSMNQEDPYSPEEPYPLEAKLEDSQVQEEALSVDSNQNANTLEEAKAQQEANLEPVAVTEEPVEPVQTATETVAAAEGQNITQPEEEILPEESTEEVFSLEEYEETASLDGDITLAWPVTGDIVMDYSMDTAIYDATLDQYRTNDSISIAAAEGTDVTAAAGGVVEYVGVDSRNGQTVVIQHDNGWRTTYSQLAEAVAVNQGDTVTQGQVIGQVGTPTKYAVALGPHLDFTVTSEDTTLDPKLALAE